MRGSDVAQAEAQMAVGLGSSAFASQGLSIFDGLLAAVSRKRDVRRPVSAPERGHLPDHSV